LRSEAGAILACDFFTADLLDGTQGLLAFGRGGSWRPDLR
jgi:hypothetical protein